MQEGMMVRRALALGAVLLMSAGWAQAQQLGIQRKTLLQQDGPAGYQTFVNLLEFAPGAREVRHVHPGVLAGYVLEGALTLEREGLPPAIYKAGDAFSIDAGRVHVGINDSAAPVRLVVTLTVEKGKPPSSPAP
jgi:quercetin dioxygenase-like cupin family protein